MTSFYPIFFVIAGFAASTLLTGRALSLMGPDAKAALVDISSSTRLLSLAAICIFVGLVLWHPLYGWVFLGCAYLGLGVRSIFRLRRLNLPAPAARLILAGNLCAVAGIVAAATIFALRVL